MSMHYSDPRRESDEHALPNIETFHHDCTDNDQPCELDPDPVIAEYECAGPGWYYWPCFPGCLPDSDPIGPFATEAEALADARDGIAEEE